MLIRHSPDLVSLTFGVLFAAIGILLLFGQLDGIRLDWLIPVITVVLCVLLIVLASPIGRKPKPDDEPSDGWTDVRELGLNTPGAITRRDLDGREVLFCLVDSTLYAYGARCPACEADIGSATVAGRSLTCPRCGQAYDLIRAGRALDRPDLQLTPFPLLTRDGCTRVALPPRRVPADLATV